MIDQVHAWLLELPLEHAVMVVSAAVSVLVTLITLALFGAVLCIIKLVEDRRSSVRITTDAIDDPAFASDIPNFLPSRSRSFGARR